MRFLNSSWTNFLQESAENLKLMSESVSKPIKRKKRERLLTNKEENNSRKWSLNPNLVLWAAQLTNRRPSNNSKQLHTATTSKWLTSNIWTTKCRCRTCPRCTCKGWCLSSNLQMPKVTSNLQICREWFQDKPKVLQIIK